MCEKWNKREKRKDENEQLMSLIFPAIMCDLKLIESLLLLFFFSIGFLNFFFSFRSIALSLACCSSVDTSMIHQYTLCFIVELLYGLIFKAHTPVHTCKPPLVCIVVLAKSSRLHRMFYSIQPSNRTIVAYSTHKQLIRCHTFDTQCMERLHC